MVLLLGFSALAIHSVGIFLLPPPLALLHRPCQPWRCWSQRWRVCLPSRTRRPLGGSGICAPRGDANQLSETPFPPVQSRRTSSPVHRVPLCLRPAPRALRRRQLPGSHHPTSGAQSPAVYGQSDVGEGRGEQAEDAPSIDSLGRYGARIISAELPHQDDANDPEPSAASTVKA